MAARHVPRWVTYRVIVVFGITPGTIVNPRKEQSTVYRGAPSHEHDAGQLITVVPVNT